MKEQQLTYIKTKARANVTSWGQIFLTCMYHHSLYRVLFENESGVRLPAHYRRNTRTYCKIFILRKNTYLKSLLC